MGEPTYSLTSGQLLSPIMRISRGKMFLYFALIGAMLLTVLLLRNAHSNLKTLEGSNANCQRKHDSLSAQLQVVYEQKNRLKKSLQQEKIDSQSKKKELEKQLQEEDSKYQHEKEKIQALEEQLNGLKARFAELENDKKLTEAKLKDQLDAFQTQKDDEINKLQAHISDVLEEKTKLANANTDLTLRVKQHSSDVSLCQVQLEQVIQKLTQCGNSLKNNELMHSQKSSSLQDIKMSDVKLKLDAVSIPNVKNTLNRPRLQDESKGEPDIAVNLSPDVDAPILKKYVNVDSVHPNGNNVSLNVSSNVMPNLEGVNHPDGIIDKFKKPMNSEDVLAAGLDQVYAPDRLNESENLPQVQPPAAERGEYVNGALPEQLEQPDFNNGGNDVHGGPKRNNFPVPNAAAPNNNNNNNVDAAQVRDMLDKSPGDVNEINGNPPMNIPPPHDQRDAMIDHARHLDQQHKGKQYAPGMIDKNYVDEDEDDQGDNDDDRRVLGVPQKFFQENDFADQDSIDNRGRNEEGVMVHPK